MTILIIEDEAFNTMVLEEMLRLLFPETEVLTAEHGEAALQLLQTHRPDLILSDINMPVMDGYAFIQAFREQKGDTVPVIAVTAFAIQGDREKILLAGFDDYISKPIDMEALQSVVGRVFSNGKDSA